MSPWPKPVGRCEKQPRGWKKRREREMGSERGEEGPGLAIENSSNVIEKPAGDLLEVSRRRV